MEFELARCLVYCGKESQWVGVHHYSTFFSFFFHYDLLWLVHIKIGVNIYIYIYIYIQKLVLILNTSDSDVLLIIIDYVNHWKKKITFLSVNLKILYANLCTWHASYSQNNSKTNFPPLGFWIAFEANFLFKKKTTSCFESNSMKWWKILIQKPKRKGKK